jgi:hypothetical protein
LDKLTGSDSKDKSTRPGSETTVTNKTYCHCGALLSETTTTTKDPDPFKIIVDNTAYEVDEYGLIYTDKTPYFGHQPPDDCPKEDFIDCDRKDIALEITAKNIDKLVISSITGNKYIPRGGKK